MPTPTIGRVTNRVTKNSNFFRGTGRLGGKITAGPSHTGVRLMSRELTYMAFP